jgi:excinuclease ABC A subunit
VADRLIIKGAREHNLRSIDLELPRDALIVFTGLSGSGKSSLAFDTIFAEGQRRYVESLSAYARQFLGQMDKPDVDFIEGLSPAVSIDQKSTNRNPRSTVGTITEVYDYLRLLYARAGTPHCPVCGERIARQTPQQIVDQVLAMDEGLRFQVLAPVVRTRKGEFVDLFDKLNSQGYSRVRVDGVVHSLTDPPTLKKQEKHDIEVVVDRLTVKATAKQRLTDSVETALNLADGIVVLEFVDREDNHPHREQRFSEKLACPNGHRGRSRSTRPTAPARNALGWASRRRSTPNSSCRTRTSLWPRARSRRGRWGRRPSTSPACCRDWGISWASTSTRRGRSCLSRRARQSSRAATSRCTCATATGTAEPVRTTPISKA